MMRPDLHLHTTASDGLYAPTQVAQLAQRADITFFSITDHDTLAGLSEAADAAYDRGLAFLPGVEISAEGEDEVHILGYGVKENDQKLLEFFAQMARERQERALKMAKRLEEMGMPLPIQDVIAEAGDSVGRPHLARALVAKGFAQSTQEAFERYLNKGCAAYVSREKLPASRAISFLRERGAVPVLAHPALLKQPIERLLPLLDAWQDAGLQGIEVYHPANAGTYPMWDHLARQRGLLVTGGSDFHSEDAYHGSIGQTISAWPDPGEDAWALFQAARRA